MIPVVMSLHVHHLLRFRFEVCVSEGILYIEPSCLDVAFKQCPKILTMASRTRGNNTVFVVSNVSSPFVDNEGVMHVNVASLSLLVMVLYDFFHMLRLTKSPKAFLGLIELLTKEK